MTWNIPPGSILVPHDLEHPFPEALAAAAALAPAASAVTVLYVVAPIPTHATLADEKNLEAQTHLERPLRRLRAALDDAGLSDARAHVAFGPPGPAIVEAIERDAPDLVIMPTHGRRGLQRLVLGSVTEYVVRHAHRPVLVLPPSSDRSPTTP